MSHRKGILEKRSTCVSTWLLLLGLTQACGLWDGSENRSEERTQAQMLLNLESGLSIVRELPGGESDHYTLTLTAGHFVEIRVEQRGIDVDVKLLNRAGERITRIDNPNGNRGLETLFITTETTASYGLEISSSSPAPGHYALMAEKPRLATSRDRRRVAAERSFEEAENLRRFKKEKKLRLAVKLQQATAEEFAELDLPGREADSWERLSRCHDLLGETEETIQSGERARRFYQESDRTYELAGVLNTLGKAYRARGEPEKAIDLYNETVSLTADIPDAEQFRAVALASAGRSYMELSQFDEAMVSLEQALVLYRRINDPKKEGITLSVIGSLEIQLGRDSHALENLEQALGLLKATDETRQIAVTLSGMAHVQSRLDHPEEALALLRQALELIGKVGDRRETVNILSQFGWVYRKLDRLNDALIKYEEALDLAEDRPSKAVALINLGTTYFELEQDEAAVQRFRQALSILQTAANPDNEAAAWLGLGRAQRRQGLLEESKRSLLEAVEFVDSLRRAPGSPDRNTSFFAEKQWYFEHYIDLLMELHDKNPDAGHDVLAFEASERARARTLLDLLAESAKGLRDDVDPGWLAEEEQLGQDLNIASRERQLAATLGQRKAAEQKVKFLLERRDRLQAKIRRTHPRYASLTQGAPSSLVQIQRRLDDETMLMEYALGTEQSYVWLVTSDSLVSVRLKSRETIDSVARKTHDLLVKSRHTLARTRVSMALAEATSLLLEPIAENWRGHRLLVVADGALHYLPFAALPWPSDETESPDKTTSRELLGNRLEVVMIPSASSLVDRRRVESYDVTKTLALLGDPVFSQTDPRIQQQPSSHTQLKQQSPTKLARLPFTRIEVETILGLIGEDQRRVALGFDAHRDLVLSGELARYRMLHFATHALIDSEHPELSGLVLSQVDEQGLPRDGFVRTHDIHRLSLPAELVVLSACKTALGKQVRGEGLLGLTRSFMVAGSRRVLVSLWQVEDRATARLMELFYRQMLIEDEHPAAALRQAQMTLRQSPGWEAPYYWAAFVLNGD